MSTLDAGFYFVDQENAPMHIGSLAVFEAPAPSELELLDLYASKLPRVPRLRQVVRTTPGQVFRPFWADDQHFELRYHLRRGTVAPPGGSAQLADLAGHVFSQRMDRDRPLWEAWFLDGLEHGSWAIISKVHHCMVDGIGGSDLMAQLFDIGPGPAGRHQGNGKTPGRGSPRSARSHSARRTQRPWHAGPRPSIGNALATGTVDAALGPVRQLAELPAFVRRRLTTPAELAAYGRGLFGGARRLAAPSASILNGPISPDRRFAWTTAALDEVKHIRKSFGVTVNDVILAVITNGFRELLDSHDQLDSGMVVRSLVPVSLRSEHGGTAGRRVSNKLSAVLVNLPVGESAAQRRLKLLHEEMDQIKRTRQAVGPELLLTLLGLATPAVLALSAKVAFKLPQPLVQTVTTNVPGPRFPLYILGRRMTELYPYVPIADRLRIGIAVFSYLETFTFGITTDHAAVTDADVDTLMEGIEHGVAELLALRDRPRGLRSQ